MAFYHTGFGHTCANTQQKHTRMTKCNFIILSPFKYWHACLTLQLGQQQVPAQPLWPNQSCNKVSAPQVYFASLPETSSHLFWYVLSFLFFYAKITWLFPTSIRNGSKISFEFCWSLHTVDLWFSVNAWWLPLSGTLFIQHGWPLQHLLRRNSTVVAGSAAEFGQRTFFIPAKRNLKESEEEKVNLQRRALSLQIPVTLSNPPWPSNFWSKDNCEWELTMKCSEALRQQGLLLILSYCFEDKWHGDSEWPTGRYHWWPSLGLLLEAVDE